MQFPARGGLVGQNAKCKNVAQFRVETFGADVFFPKKCPVAPGNCVFLCSARNFCVPRAALGQKGLKTSILQFPALGGPVGQDTKCKKVAQFRGETFGAYGFSFCFQPGISLSAKGCSRPKGPRKLVFCNFPPVGVPWAKTQKPKKLRNFGDKILGRTYFPPKKCP